MVMREWGVVMILKATLYVGAEVVAVVAAFSALLVGRTFSGKGW